MEVILVLSGSNRPGPDSFAASKKTAYGRPGDQSTTLQSKVWYINGIPASSSAPEGQDQDSLGWAVRVRGLVDQHDL